MASIACLGRAGIVATAVLAFVFSTAVRAEKLPPARTNEAALRQMIGQMILIGFVGDHIDAPDYRTVRQQAADGKITGVIYLRRNIRSKSDVQTMNATLQSAARQTLLISVDQEGGRIERLTKQIGFREIPSAANVASQMSPPEAMRLYQSLAHDLADLGFNVNFGPVVDVNINPRNPIIGRLGRSYSSKPDIVIAYAQAFIDAHAKFGVLTSLKHFPGHGSSTSDSHKGAVDVTDTWQEEKEIEPYKALLNDLNTSMVMSSHVINRKLSGRAVPASLSSDVLQNLLRRDIGFSGVVISDDMQMDAIAGTRSFEQAVREAVMAGNDILIFANDKHPDPQIPEKITDLLMKAALSDKALLARIRESSTRVKKMKDQLGRTTRLLRPVKTTPDASIKAIKPDADAQDQ